MSVRSLFEINHDFTHRLDDGFAIALQNYLASGSLEAAADLERYGFIWISQRHHSSDYHIHHKTDGFA